MTATVCVTYDLDAVSPWIWTFDLPDRHRAGVFGAETGTKRLLDLHEKLDIPSTWFIPGHTIENFPDACEDVHDRGHEIQHHSWCHAPLSSYNTKEQEEADFVRGIEAIEELVGDTPDGFRAPLGGMSEFTIDLLLDYDFEWLSSDMARSFTPYYFRNHPTVSKNEPYDPGELTDLVNVPFNWQRDDWELTGYIRSDPDPRRKVTSGSMMSETDFFDRLLREFDWMVENVENGVYVLLFHPQISGQGNSVANIEDLIQSMKSRGAEFKEISTVVEEFDQ
jgi:peptidoglycan/xylan/chitin deacetylase (PgdA/CDA1 family)